MNKITLHHISGDFWSYESLEDVYNQLGYNFISNNVGEQFDNVRAVTVYVNCRAIVEYRQFHADFILRDEKGKEIIYSDFKMFLEKDRNLRSKMQCKKMISRGNGPIEGTRKRRGRYKIIKRPRSMNEKRNVSKCLTEAFDNNVYIKLRSKRNIVNLPDAYDDINRADVDDRSWKANKRNKHQWK